MAGQRCGIPTFVQYSERFLRPLTPDRIVCVALRYGLSTEQIGNHWLLSEAGVFFRYLTDLRLRISEFDGKDCIDVGCGFGFFKKGIVQHTSPQSFVNLDHRTESPALVDVIADARRLPFRDSSFDIALAYGSVYGVLRDTNGFRLSVMPPDGLAEIVRILRPGGIATVGPISLLRSCWRVEEDIEFYLESIRRKIFSHLALLKDMFPAIRIELWRNIDAENHKRFDEWLRVRK